MAWLKKFYLLFFTAQLSGIAFAQFEQKLVGSNPQVDDAFGASVSIYKNYLMK